MYDDWRSENIQWMAQEETRTNPDGTPYYERIQAPWDFQGYVLMKWHNDRKATEKNLSPMSNSTIDMKYHGRLITGEAFDSSYLRTQPRDSVFRTKLNNTINGWIIGVSQMHVGDSCTIDQFQHFMRSIGSIRCTMCFCGHAQQADDQQQSGLNNRIQGEVEVQIKVQFRHGYSLSFVKIRLPLAAKGSLWRITVRLFVPWVLPWVLPDVSYRR